MLLRRLTEFMDGWTANGVRYPMSAVLYWPVLFLARRSGHLNWPLVRRCCIPAAFAFGGQVFWALAHYQLPASEIGFYIRLSTVWAIIGSIALFPDERALLRKPMFFAGVALIAVGFLVLSWPSSRLHVISEHAVVTGGNHALGLAFILLCGVFFGFYMVSVRRCIPDVAPLLSFGVVANLVSIGTIAGMLIKGDVHAIATLPSKAWCLLIGSSIIGIAIGHILMYISVQRLGAAISSACQAAMPFITATVAAVFLREALSTQQWAGGSLMVGGAMLLLTIKQVLSTKPTSGPAGKPTGGPAVSAVASRP